jgi:hypothetical protein
MHPGAASAAPLHAADRRQELFMFQNSVLITSPFSYAVATGIAVAAISAGVG